LTDSGIVGDPAQIAALQQDLVQRLQDPRSHLRARIAAGEVLGKLGDPRFQAIQVNGQRVLLPPLVPIPAGSFKMGSGFWEVWRLVRGGFPWAQNERPRHLVEVANFYIGRCPVTNAEFACFIDAGGYQDERWWTPEIAQRWLRGEYEGGAVESLMKTWRSLKANPARLRQLGWSAQVVANWERLLTLDEAAFRQLANKNIVDRRRDQAGHWHDARYTVPSQPVIGVTWFEARAYCAWLDAQWRIAAVESPLRHGYQVRLPTEAEWEKAARYPHLVAGAIRRAIAGRTTGPIRTKVRFYIRRRLEPIPPVPLLPVFTT
jgi:formylglycine-generating enzyme required for sulfatase activity